MTAKITSGGRSSAAQAVIERGKKKDSRILDNFAVGCAGRRDDGARSLDDGSAGRLHVGGRKGRSVKIWAGRFLIFVQTGHRDGLSRF